MADDAAARRRAWLAAEERFIADRGGARWIETYIRPYCLEWMGVGGRSDEACALIPQIRARAAELSVEDIAQMVRRQWRVQVMGAWYAVARADSVFTNPLHRAFDYCYGTLTAPCLTAAVLIYPDATTADVLASYRERDIEHQYGAAGIVDAALRRLAPDLAPPDPTPEDDVLDGLLKAARQLQAPS